MPRTHGVLTSAHLWKRPRRRPRPRLKTATSGANGRFSMRGITPGDYKLFAWEDIEPFSYFDSVVLRRFEALRKTVHIQENSRETAEVKIIRATR
jgi:hypothetical protein